MNELIPSLSKVDDIPWVLEQCRLCVADNARFERKILKYGLDLATRNISISSFENLKKESSKRIDKEILRIMLYRVIFLQYLLRLDSYIASLDNEKEYDSKVFAQYCSVDLYQLALYYAGIGEFHKLSLLFQYHCDDTYSPYYPVTYPIPKVFSILNAIPECFNPTEYSFLLPHSNYQHSLFSKNKILSTIITPEFSAFMRVLFYNLRNRYNCDSELTEWLLSPPKIKTIDLTKEDEKKLHLNNLNIKNSVISIIKNNFYVFIDSKYIPQFWTLSGLEQHFAWVKYITKQNKTTEYTNDQLVSWYTDRARMMDRLAGQIQNGKTLLFLGIELKVDGLKSLYQRFEEISTLIFVQKHVDISIKNYEQYGQYDRLTYVFKHSTMNTIFDDIYSLKSFFENISKDTASRFMKFIVKKAMDAELTSNQWNAFLANMMSLQKHILSSFLSQSSVYSCVTHAILTTLNVSLASTLLNSNNSPLSRADTEQVVLRVAREYFNSATHSNDDAIHIAQRILQYTLEDSCEEIETELMLINGIKRLTEFGIDVSPLEIRLSTKREDYIMQILNKNIENFTTDSIFELSKLLNIKPEQSWSMYVKFAEKEDSRSRSSRSSDNLISYALSFCPIDELDNVIGKWKNRTSIDFSKKTLGTTENESNEYICQSIIKTLAEDYNKNNPSSKDKNFDLVRLEPYNKDIHYKIKINIGELFEHIIEDFLNDHYISRTAPTHAIRKAQALFRILGLNSNILSGENQIDLKDVFLSLAKSTNPFDPSLSLSYLFSLFKPEKAKTHFYEMNTRSYNIIDLDLKSEDTDTTEDFDSWITESDF